MFDNFYKLVHNLNVRTDNTAIIKANCYFMVLWVVASKIEVNTIPKFGLTYFLLINYELNSKYIF